MDFKKSVLALLALGLTGVASAGGFMPAPACTNHPVTVPCERSAWDIGVTGYWGRVSSNQMNVDSADVFVDSAQVASNAVFINPDYKFAFGLEGSYHWGTGNDLTVTWMHYDKSFEERGEFEFGSRLTGVDNSIFINQAKFELDAVNAEIGQHIDVGPAWDLRAHIGGQYMKLDRELNYRVASSQAQLDAGTYVQFRDLSNFKGIGPRAGFDAAYNIADGFALIGKSAVSVLFGEIESSRIGYSYVNQALAAQFDYNLGEKNAVVAGVDGRLGLRYTHSMSNGSFSIEGGYAGSVYMDPIMVNPVATTDTEETSAYFAIGSAYVTLKYVS